MRGGLPYLRAVWSNQTWTLYAVASPQPVISPPGQVVARDPVSLTLFLPQRGDYVVRVRWSRFVSSSAGCVRPALGGWTMITVDQPGSVKIEGSFLLHHC